MSGGRGFTFIETMIAAFMIMASLVVMTQLMMRPVEVVTTLSPKAEAQQITLHLAQDQVEQFRVSSPTSPLANPAPGPTPAGIQTGFTVAVYNETALAADVPPSSPTLSLNSCANIRGPAESQPGSKIQIDVMPNAEFADVASIAAGSPCTVTLTSPTSPSLTHALGSPVVPAIPGTTAPLVLDKAIFHQYLTVLVTTPLVGTRLFADATQNATQITVRDASSFKAREGATPGSFIRIDSDAQMETALVSTIAGTTLTLESTLGKNHSLGALVAVAARSTAIIAAGEKCITVDDITLFQKEIGVEIDTGTNMENAIVKGIDTATCGGANTVELTRPLRKAHAASVAVVPAVFSASSFSVIGGGKQKLGI